MLSCDKISLELNKISEENAVLQKLLHRNKNQHGKSSLHGQLQGLCRVLKHFEKQSKYIVLMNTEMENCIRNLRRPKVSSGSTVTLGTKSLIGSTQVVVVLSECIELTNKAARNVNAQISLMLFLPLFTVYYALVSRLSMSFVKLAVHHFKALHVWREALQTCASGSPKFHDVITDTISSYNLHNDVVIFMNALIDDGDGSSARSCVKDADLCSPTPNACSLSLHGDDLTLRDSSSAHNDFEDLGESVGLSISPASLSQRPLSSSKDFSVTSVKNTAVESRGMEDETDMKLSQQSVRVSVAETSRILDDDVTVASVLPSSLKKRPRTETKANSDESNNESFVAAAAGSSSSGGSGVEREEGKCSNKKKLGDGDVFDETNESISTSDNATCSTKKRSVSSKKKKRASSGSSKSKDKKNDIDDIFGDMF